uniref:Uncharacterized protein n=2 Tax=Oryza brachyantha TaxID=4533 RepID=J3MYT4_ORYBR
MMALKYVALLLVFLVAFLCHSLAICFLNEASFLVNTSSTLLPSSSSDEGRRLLGLPSTMDYIDEVLERGFTLSFAGNRIFFAGVPLLLWIFGPLLAFLSSLVMIPILYNLDVVNPKPAAASSTNGKLDKINGAAAIDCATHV